MDRILNLFGISKELLNVDDQQWDNLVTNKVLCTNSEIVQTLEMITPIPSGHELVRIGPDGDGGYLVPNDMEGIEACFSPGTCNSKSFEDTLAEEYGIKSFMCDYSSDVDKLNTPIIEGLQFFEKKWLDIQENDISVEINSWVKNNSAPSTDLILQMDIEGYEYKNLIHCSEETLQRFRIIVLEIHFLFFLNDPQFLNGIFLPVMNKLSSHFSCVHAHPNNGCPTSIIGDSIEIPQVLEITFLRKDRVNHSSSIPVQLPHPLDVYNDNSRQQIPIASWMATHADRELSQQNKTNQSMAWLEKRVLSLTSEVDLLKEQVRQLMNQGENLS